jgi:hypothetical protein
MSNLEEVGEQKENTQMNWFVAAMLVVGSPFFVLASMNHHWADIALKVYIVTASAFGAILLFLERKYLKERWLWAGMIPVVLLHATAMWGLVLFNEAFPQIDRFPVAAYGALVPIGACEIGILYVVIEKFRPKKDSSESLSRDSDNDSLSSGSIKP